jgi:integrase
MVKAFGKHDLENLSKCRSFELYFGIISPVGPEAWKSTYPSVQNLLDHLGRYSKSEASRRTYLNLLQAFCMKTGYNPDQLTAIPKDTINSLIQEHIDELARNGASVSYANTVNKRIKTFFRANKIKPDTRSYYQPTRYRKRPETIPTKPEIYRITDAADNQRDRAVILSLWSCGLRVSTFSSLTIADIQEELENNEPIIQVPVYPEMKKRVPNACKGLVPYYCFISAEAQQALRVYLKEREEYYGSLEPDQPLFCSDWNLWPRRDRPLKHLGRRAIGVILKKSARLAGLRAPSSPSLDAF